MVSEIGSFAEFPDDVCLKVSVGAGEEDIIFEYLNLLVSRPEVARALGERARDYVARECNWAGVARRYVHFLAAPSESPVLEPAPAPPPAIEPARVPELAPYLSGWAVNEEARRYLETHQTRLVKTLEITPTGGPCDRVLEMGAYLQMTPALRTKLGYGHVRGCYYGKLGRTDHREVVSEDGERFTCEIDHFDAEKDRFPYQDGWFSTVLCCELIEHL